MFGRIEKMPQVAYILGVVSEAVTSPTVNAYATNVTRTAIDQPVRVFVIVSTTPFSLSFIASS
jgi:hypothetical protein